MNIILVCRRIVRNGLSQLLEFYPFEGVWYCHITHKGQWQASVVRDQVYADHELKKLLHQEGLPSVAEKDPVGHGEQSASDNRVAPAP